MNRKQLLLIAIIILITGVLPITVFTYTYTYFTEAIQLSESLSSTFAKEAELVESNQVTVEEISQRFHMLSEIEKDDIELYAVGQASVLFFLISTFFLMVLQWLLIRELLAIHNQKSLSTAEKRGDKP